MTETTHFGMTDAGSTPEPDRAFLDDVLEGLSGRPRTIPSKYFYDARGSRLFETITELEEYYPTRTELSIMKQYVHEMVASLGPRCLIVEFGSGSSIKTRILLDALGEPAGYVPIDISRDPLLASARRLADAYPNVPIRPVHADYTEPFELPHDAFDAARTVVYFPGSTIGNFEPLPAKAFLSRMAKVAGNGGGLLIGVDLEKDIRVLEAAYNDARGVTAAFNKNLLRRVNRELGGTFDPDGFKHEAVYNPSEGRIEMYLVSRVYQSAFVDDVEIEFLKDERILTEYSYKYTPERFADLARSAGLRPNAVWTDDKRYFSVQYLETI